MSVNQREFERVRCNTALTLVLGDGKTEVAAMCRDISEGGIGLQADRPLSLGTECDVKIHDGRATHSKYQARIEIVRVRSEELDGDEVFVMGAVILHRY